jgi:hypothetical protein
VVDQPVGPDVAKLGLHVAALVARRAVVELDDTQQRVAHPDEVALTKLGA